MWRLSGNVPCAAGVGYQPRRLWNRLLTSCGRTLDCDQSRLSASQVIGLSAAVQFEYARNASAGLSCCTRRIEAVLVQILEKVGDGRKRHEPTARDETRHRHLMV